MRKVAVCAVVVNPLAGSGWVDDLSPLIGPSSALGCELGRLAAAALGDSVESYGKAAVVGISGEQEHANACLTSAFGDAFRAAIGGGEAWISSVTKTAGPGCLRRCPPAQLRAREGFGLSEAVNRLVRQGLMAPEHRLPFVQRTSPLGLKIDVSNVAEAIDLIEGHDAR